MCQEPNRAAGIRCSLPAGSCIDGQTRLVDGPTFYEGRLEVCLDNQWLSVCDAGFSLETAYDVCNSRLLLFGGVYFIIKSACALGMSATIIIQMPLLSMVVPMDKVLGHC